VEVERVAVSTLSRLRVAHVVRRARRSSCASCVVRHARRARRSSFVVREEQLQYGHGRSVFRAISSEEVDSRQGFALQPETPRDAPK
jgi:hypothetical protein